MNSHDHHPSEAWLLDFALGNLNPAFETVLDVHVGMCIDCQKTVEMAENIGGEILATLASRSAPATTNDLREAIGRGEFKEGKPSRAVPTVVADSFEHFISTT